MTGQRRALASVAGVAADVSVMRRLSDTFYDVLAQQATKPPSPRQQQAAAIQSCLDALAIPLRPFSYRAQGASGFERFDLVGQTVEADSAARIYRDFLFDRGAGP